MAYTIILLSIALAVSVGFWVRADRMAAHYRRERDADRERLKADADIMRLRGDKLRDGWTKTANRAQALLRETKDLKEQVLHIESRHARELVATRRQLAAARWQITKLRKRLGEIE